MSYEVSLGLLEDVSRVTTLSQVSSLSLRIIWLECSHIITLTSIPQLYIQVNLHGSTIMLFLDRKNKYLLSGFLPFLTSKSINSLEKED